MCEIMIEFLWDIVKCRFLLEEHKKVIIIRKMSLLITIKQESKNLYYDNNLCSLLKLILIV